MSPVWIIKAGGDWTAFTLPMASRRAPRASGLAGLLKPTWLSLICRKVKPAGIAANASPSRPMDFGTPPESVHKSPVPAQTMHVSAPLRLRPDGSPSGASVTGLALSTITMSPSFAIKRYEQETDARGRLFPQKPICRSWQTESRAAMPGSGLVLPLLMRGPVEERLKFHQQECPLWAPSGDCDERCSGSLLTHSGPRDGIASNISGDWRSAVAEARAAPLSTPRVC